ncbi:S41 family peptidase [Gabonibacter massiliensis]|uniref:S41 family peptidase n=1 Tax=Gabonibacter massiliensis TaxID=1720195 RepID=UPI00073E4939|nr:S41 family peptidase [Gabonibacter massiliensis]
MSKLYLTLVLFFIWGVLSAGPLWMRYPSISPDGKQIVFSYKGDIYKVSADGGRAEQLTTNPGYETYPIWSPDGKYIAFASDRYGNLDIFIMLAEGGTPKRLTTYSGKEIPYAFTPDGKEIVYGAQIQDPAESALFPSPALTELYAVSVNGGRPRQVLGTPAESICFSKSGKQFLYHDKKGGENEWRKHHTSSVTRDIYLYDIKSKKHTNLVGWQGEDRNPVFAPGDEKVYFLSERGGSFNIYSFNLTVPDRVEPVTSFKNRPVRFLSIANTGRLCFGYDGEIYIKDEMSNPKKVAVEIRGDQAIDDREELLFTSGATDAEVSPDGKQIALILRGEVFVTSTDYVTTKQVTETPEQEKWLSFAPDNRTLAYASERNGNWNIYTAKMARKEEINFPNATLIDEEAVLPASSVERFAPQFSPDGKELAFIEDRNKLMVVNLQNKKVRQITDGSMHYRTGDGFTYKWSPDGKWFALEFIGNKHDPYGDIGIVRADGGGQIINLTRSGYSNGNPRWVLDGNAILFSSERYGMRNHASWGSLEDVMIVFLNQDAYDRFRLSKEDYELLKQEEKSAYKGEEKSEKQQRKAIVVELKGIEDRIVRLTPSSSELGDAVLSREGEKLYYLASFEGGLGLWEMNLRSKNTRLIHKLNGNWGSLVLDKSGNNLFLLGSRNMQKINLQSDKQTPVVYRAMMELDRVAERAYMFDRVRRQEAKRFYDKDMHGVDWPAVTKDYEKFLPYINNNHDFSELLSELLGELNVSHTGGRFYPEERGDETAETGLLFEWNERRPGLIVTEILEKGPFDNARSKVRAGDVLEKIDGQKIEIGMDYFPMLNKKRGEKTLFSFYNPESQERWEEVIKPISKSSMRQLLYRRWVKQRAAEVDRLSGGRLGYVHIASMSDPSFRSIYSDILGKYNDREGIVIDTRFNGGGRLHEDIEVLFSGEKYFTQVVRGREACDMPSRRWNKPSVMIIGEANYSNAHGTPWVYKYKNIGKLVGMPVPGTMTSVSWERLQDPTLVFGIPIVGYRLADGSYLENKQLEPDVKVANSPEKVVSGKDEQLEKAVEELLGEIGRK